MRPFKRSSAGLASSSACQSQIPVSVSWACRDGAGPQWLWHSMGHQDMARQQCPFLGRVLSLPGCSWSGVKQGEWEVSLLHFLWQSHVVGNAVLYSSRGDRACKSWQVEVLLLLGNNPRSLLLSHTTCLHIFAISPD